MPTPTAPSRGATPDSTLIALDRCHGADLAHLLDCLREWIDAEHDQLEPLLDRHNYDINELRIALDHNTALLRSSLNQATY